MSRKLNIICKSRISLIRKAILLQFLLELVQAVDGDDSIYLAFTRACSSASFRLQNMQCFLNKETETDFFFKKKRSKKLICYGNWKQFFPSGLL